MKNIYLRIFSLLILCFLNGCGGGGGGGGSSNVAGASASLTAPPLFANAPILSPDLKSKYDLLCGSLANMQNIIPIDLNKDGKLDLLMNIWCGSTPGLTNDKPVPNTIIALIQGENFTFQDKTEQIFGKSLIDIGGVGIRYVKYDFNGDGYDDIVFAVNMEDGRKGSTTLVPCATIMSDGRGGYKAEKIGSNEFSQGLTLKDNEFGGKDVVLMPSNEVLRYANGWNIVDKYDWIGWVQTIFEPRTTSNLASEIAYAQGAASTDYNYYKLNNSIWENRGSYSLPGKYVPFISYTGDLGQTKMFNMDGKDYVIGGFVESCLFKRNSVSNYEMIGLIVGNEIVGNYNGGILYENASYPVMSKFISLGLDNNNVFGRLPIVVNNELQGISPHRMNCEDLNSDGYDDIVIYRWRGGEKPIIYLNNKNGGFNRVKDTNFPIYTTVEAGQLYVDIDGDGIRDLIYYPILQNYRGNVNYGRLIIYKGNRQINSADSY